MKTISFIFLISYVVFGCAQKSFQLTDELKEISGLELYRDSIFFAINDGGNKSEIFVLSKKMQVLKKVEVENVKNRDWEALAMDDKYLYIADIGNNLNLRKNLQIHRVSLKRLVEKEKVVPETMEINYAEQRDFPPKDNELYFDAEAMIAHNGSLWIFTKNRTSPFNGKSFVYEISFSPGTSKNITKSFEIAAGKSGWLSDSFTGAASYKDYVYLLTYTQIIRFKWKGKSLQKVDEKSFPGFAQMEAITINNKGEIFIANEAHKWLGRQKIQQFQWKK
jgi:hypothetical protein